ncbi:MAG: hypothetical protein JXQ91_00505 [Vannielia sp.]|uniref:hypothetical protein n=1 Tax=Rhodobacterales TaxID=204455 RepID=UPI0020951D43|nr:hypothetical protein [Oceanicola sp. 502str15]MCO6382593.1 hypothetical protein [Oceanicola sp. 502str15]
MKRLVLPVAALALALGAATASAQSATIKISCKRGPLPKVSLINGANWQFIQSIEENYRISPVDAKAAADYVCADMSAVGDAAKLRARTQRVLANYRRR